jgi:hypothetical protein
LGPLLVVTWIALAVPTAARGPGDVKRYLDSAAAFYDKLDFERALDQARRAEAFSRGPDDDVQIALIEGIMLASLAREDDADAAFRKGLSLKPDAQLPYTVSPKIQKRFEAVRTEVNKVVGPLRELPETSASTPDTAAAAQSTDVDTSAGTSGPNTRVLSVIPAVAGVALVTAATISWVVAQGQYNSLTQGTVSPAVALQYKSSGPTNATVGWVCMGTGVVALGAAAVLFATGGKSSGVEASAMWIPGGASVALSGAFP